MERINVGTDLCVTLQSCLDWIKLHGICIHIQCSLSELSLCIVACRSGTFNIGMKPEKSIWMGDTKLKNLRICHPEARAITVYHLIKHLLYISCVSAFTKVTHCIGWCQSEVIPMEMRCSELTK